MTPVDPHVSRRCAEVVSLLGDATSWASGVAEERKRQTRGFIARVSSTAGPKHTPEEKTRDLPPDSIGRRLR